EGIEHIVSDGRRKSEQPLILLVPHFLGLDVGGSTLAMHIDAVSIYSQQKDGAVDALLKHGRQRFGDQQLLARHEGIRATVKALRDRRPFYYLPDMAYGAREAVLVPFFRVPAATINGTSRLASLTRPRPPAGLGEMWPGRA